jgi:hypothetical protein
MSLPFKAGKKLLIIAIALYILKGIVVTAVLLWAFLF